MNRYARANQSVIGFPGGRIRQLVQTPRQGPTLVADCAS